MSKLNYQIQELNEKYLHPKYGFLDTLNNLRLVDNLSENRAIEILNKIKAQGSYILVALNEDNQIIGSVTLMIEQKFLHNGSVAGHIEDLVTRKGYEGQGVASALLKKAIKIAQDKKCYKLILDCQDKLIPFYEKFNFQRQESCLKIYF